MKGLTIGAEKSISRITPEKRTPPASAPPKPSISKQMPPTPPKKVLTATKTIIRKRKGAIRIKPEAQKDKSNTVVNYGNEPIQPNILTEKWEAYASKIKQTSGGFSSSILVNCEPQLKEDNKTIHIIFRNETNELEFTKMSSDLLNYLKSNLNNNNIEFTTEVNQVKAKKVLYTNRDKFDHLTKTEPKLLEWATKLGLELK